MNLMELLKRVAKGESLTDDEKAYLASYKEDDSRIPKSRLDEELAKKKELQKSLDALTAKQSELESQIDELKTTGLTAEEKAKKEVEKELNNLKKQVSELVGDRDRAVNELQDAKFKSSVAEVAGKFNFSDHEYLGFLVKSGNVDLADENKVAEFVKTLETSKPSLFKSQVKSGGGSAAPTSMQTTGEARIKELLAKTSLTMTEVGEINKLETELKTAVAQAAK